ncbi:MAG: hypothetical protein LIO71_00290 [Ruminococcus sp.]|nr:hypothetical protein [Ruminococcus sp.]
MNNNDKDVKIQHHQYNNGSRRNKRKLHKGRVAGAIVMVALLVGVSIGGYKLAGKLSSMGDDGSISANNNVEDGNITLNTNTTLETVNPSVDAIDTTVSTTTEVTTVESTTEDTQGTTQTDKDGNIIGSDGVVSIQNDASVTTAPNDEDSSSTTTATQSGSNSDASQSSLSAYYLSEEDIADENSLKSALESIDSSYNTVVLPLKAQGGMLNYNSQINSARNAGVVASSFDLSTMVQIVKDMGLKPYASISVLYDNVYPKTFKKSAYQFEDGTGSWWDDYGEKGGKPWLSPFADDTKNYLSAISAELTEGGIEGIICTDVIFPNFREKDLDYIGDIVKSEDRYTALLDVLNVIQNSANEQTVMFQFSLFDALKGNVEALKAEELNQNIVLVPSIKLDELSTTFSYDGNSISLGSQSTYNKVKLSMELFQKMSGDLDIIPSIDMDTLTASQRKDVISALTDLGYKEYIYE